MKETTREHFVSGDIWRRGLYMLLFVFAYSVAEMIIVFLALFQFFAALFTGRANEPLLQFGKNLSTYIYEILEFQTFNTEVRPFPFIPWPDEELGGEAWLQEADLDDEETADEDDADPEDDESTEGDSDSDKK